MNKSSRYSRFLIAALFVPKVAAAYNRTAAVNYAETWWNATAPATQEPTGKANHINSSLANPPGPYLWYYDGGSDDGSNQFGPVSYVSKQNPGIGKDCANFVSQAMINGNFWN